MNPEDRSSPTVTTPPDGHASRPSNTLPGYIGPYRVLERLGEGGMGTVYKAEQREPIRRVVAIKVVKLGTDTAEVIARFESERQALARMDHPGIARVLDAGTDERGRPYFVMEFVPGIPVTAYADREKMPLRDRLLLFLQICDAVAHAHSKAILHRDIKASNVLAFTDVGGKPVAKVIDFGVAKALTSDRLTDLTFNTQMGVAVGTYESMSPEQANGSADIDARTDVYALGVLLYELLAGVKPLAGKMTNTADVEIRRIIREVDPPRPSLMLTGMANDATTRVAADRRLIPANLTRELKLELEWIPMMCLRKERDRRYASPLLLAADVRKYLDRLPLQAGPDTRRYRIRKLARRNTGPIVAAILVVAVLVLGIAGTTTGFLREASQRRVAEAAKTESERQKSDALRAKAAAEAERTEAVAQQTESENQRKSVQSVLDFLADDVLAKASPNSSHDLAVTNALVDAVIGPALDTVDERFQNQPLVRAEIKLVLAGTLYELGRYDVALPQAQASLEIRRARFGDDDIKTIAASRLVAEIMVATGRPGEAEAIAKKLFELCNRLYGSRARSTLEAGSLYGYAVMSRGRHAESESMLKAQFTLAGESLGEDDSTTLTLERRLGLSLFYQRKLTEAEPVLKHEWETEKRLFGDDDVRTVQGLSNNALVVLYAGRPAEAEPLFQQAMAWNLRVYGKDHPNTLTDTNNYSGCLTAQGRFDEAEPLLREVADFVREKTPDSLSRGRYLFSLGGCLVAEEKWAEAETVFRENWEYDRTHPDPSRPAVPKSLALLGQCLRTEKKFADYEALLKPLWEQDQHDLGDDDPKTSEVFLAYVNSILVQQHYSDAEPLMKRYWEQKKRANGGDDPDTINALSTYTDIELALDRFAAAEPLARELVETLGRTSPDDPRLPRDKLVLGVCLLKNARLADAEPLLREAWENDRPQVDAAHAATTDSLTYLNECLRAEGKPAELVALPEARPTSGPTTAPSSLPASRPVE